MSDSGPWPCVECDQPLAKATTTYCNQCGAKQPKKEAVSVGGNVVVAGGSSADAALAAQLKSQLEKTELALEASRQEVEELREEINRLESELGEKNEKENEKNKYIDKIIFFV
jgi:prefoldin subunit 5